MEKNKIFDLLNEKIKKHHLHKLKLAYSDDKILVFNCKYKNKYTRIFNFEINETTQKKYNINSKNLLLYKFNKHYKFYKSDEMLNNLEKKNCGSPKIIFDLTKNTYKISMFHIISHYANADYYLKDSDERFREYYKNIFNKENTEGIYNFVSIDYDL